MKKFLTTVVVICILGAIGWFVSVHMLTGKVSGQADSLIEYYVQSIDSHISDLEKDELLTDAEQSMVRNIRLMKEKMVSANGIHGKLDQLQKLQRELHIFFESAKSSEMASSRHFKDFNNILGERSKVRAYIQNYNDLASLYNSKLENNALYGSSLDSESGSEELPLLRFDGSVPDIGSVGL